MMDKTICVIGLGYIGLPTASLLANKGYHVHGVDVDPKTVEVINQGKIHIHEPALDVMVKSAVSADRLKASLKPIEADIFIIAVPTPFKDDHVPDVSYLQAATKAIAPFLKAGNLVILESTSPVGTTEKIANWIRELRSDLEIPSWESFDESKTQDSNHKLYLAHCPERVLPGKILRELVENDRVVGGIDSVSTEKCREFYKSFVSGQVLCTDCRTAEMVKLSENAYRDVNIAFANELSIISKKVGINAWELIKLANFHPRVNILQPGPGVGGHCIAVDPWFIVDSAPDEARLIRMAREVNDSKPDMVVQQVQTSAKEFKNPVVACYGLAFKPNVDDLRESPSVSIAAKLAEIYGDDLRLVEPFVDELPKSISKGRLVSASDAIQNADVHVCLVAHDQFKKLDWSQAKSVVDACGLLEN